MGTDVNTAWLDLQAGLAALAGRQLFFIGGAPRSGTTWLQRMLDRHPDISCAGEGLFMHHLAVPLERLMQDRANALAAKNAEVFAESGGYALPPAEHTEILLGTAILLALQQQAGTKPCAAVGEKTPENVFLYPRLHALFPRAKLIVIARDPRDLLSSAWHFFARRGGAADTEAARAAYVASALPAIEAGMRAALDHAEAWPQLCRLVTYEALHRDAAAQLAALFRFLGVADTAAVVAECVAANAFEALAGGRAAGEEDARSFYRTGLPGQWRSTFSDAIGETIVHRTVWAFPNFGWEP
jgi:hypothetical protein